MHSKRLRAAIALLLMAGSVSIWRGLTLGTFCSLSMVGAAAACMPQLAPSHLSTADQTSLPGLPILLQRGEALLFDVAVRPRYGSFCIDRSNCMRAVMERAGAYLAEAATNAPF